MRLYLIYIYIALATLAFAACRNETIIPENGCGTLSLGLTRAGASSTKAIDDDLALRILDSNGDVYIQYRAGSVPSKLILEPGTFTVIAYTENQDTWARENNGLGAPCYYGSCQVTIEFDQVAYANMQVPLTNYAVKVTFPDLFHSLFKSYEFSLISGTKSVHLKEGEKAYFDANDGGFTYKLTATNTDNTTHSTKAITYRTVEIGKLYNITYYYGTDANSGGIDIEITDDMEVEDDYVPLAN